MGFKSGRWPDWVNCLRNRNTGFTPIELLQIHDKKVNARVCPQCHVGLLEPHKENRNWHKCCICAFSKTFNEPPILYKQGKELMSVLEQATQFVSGFEGLRLHPYQNPGDRPTIGFGTTFYENGSPVTLSDPAVTAQRAEQLLEYFVNKALLKVQSLVTVPLTDNQLIALTDFQYNTGALHGSTLLAKINASDPTAADEFDKWVHEGTLVLRALVARRGQEKVLFLS